MSDNAKFKYSASEGVIQLEGSEEFVSKHFDSLTDLARLISRHVTVEVRQGAMDVPPLSDSSLATTQLAAAAAQPVISAVPLSQQIESINDYPHCFAEINSKLKIVLDVPGSNSRAKMLNTAILYCYGSKLLGDEQVSSKDIRAVCEEHGFLDGANFSKTFSDKTIFLSDGVKGGNKEVKLTFQGVKKAKEMLGGA